MLRLSLVFLVTAMIASLFGFGVVASFDVGKLLFVVFLVLAVIAFAAGALKHSAP